MIIYGYDSLIVLFLNLQQLYHFGARKVAVSAVGQIGCIPYELARLTRRSNNGSWCDARINKAIKHFNSGLRNLVNRLNSGELPGAKFVYIDSYRSSSDLVRNGASYGNLDMCHDSILAGFLLECVEGVPGLGQACSGPVSLIHLALNSNPDPPHKSNS